jgi:hypothetical protein
VRPDTSRGHAAGIEHVPGGPRRGSVHPPPDDDQPQTHAFNLAQPEWLYDHLRAGPPRNWPKPEEWEEGFDLTEADDAYSEVHPYADPRY